MESFVGLIQACVDGLKAVQFSPGGFTFSLWDAFLWLSVASILLTFIGGVMDGD